VKAASQPDTWEKGDAYEHFMGRWSRLVAREFITWLSVPAQSTWLDVGCGTGVLSRAIVEHADPASVTGVDQAENFIAFARSQGWDDRMSFLEGSAESLPLDTGRWDVVVSALLLNFLRQQRKAVSEMRRVAKPGGIVAAYVWDYADQMQALRYFWDAAVSVDPGASDLDEGARFPLCAPERLRELFMSAGLYGVYVKSIEIETRFASFDDYWNPFLSGVGPAPGYVVSLPEDRRNALREKLRSTLPLSTDGTITLHARAWAVQGHA
jgi:SAM-dependent methyltransferase